MGIIFVPKGVANNRERLKKIADARVLGQVVDAVNDLIKGNKQPKRP